MARFGKLPVKIPEGVTLEVRGQEAFVSGPKGSLSRKIPRGIKVEEKDGIISVTKSTSGKQADSVQGTSRAHIVNMIEGVTSGWSKTLEIVGAGYRGEVQGKDLVLNIGYSHPVKLEIPPELRVSVQKSLINIEGTDKDLVGQFAALVRSKRRPEPYKGTGIKYQDEVIRRKAGKQAVKGGV